MNEVQELNPKFLKKAHKDILKWYREHRRPLPWRASKDPYRIWISEVMCQQTTIAAVIPFYDRFLKRFPEVHDLANASIEDVYEVWAGLGYYSRARNLHKSAKEISSKGFPQNAAGLLQLFGFGPYTSRAVASIAFDEHVGVLDGNVIRILSRVTGRQKEWWNSSEKTYLQNLSDQLALLGDPADLNQAMMELGATVCTPQKPLCWSCPWVKECVAYEKNWVEKIPLKRPKAEGINLLWEVELPRSAKKPPHEIPLVVNDYAPFLKGQLIFPGRITVLKAKPKEFDVKHSITKYSIYVKLKTVTRVKKSDKIVTAQHLSKANPSSLLEKILKSLLREES